MGWIRVSDDFYDNDKMAAAGSIGRDLYWHGMAFCNRNLTDGLIGKGRALTLVDFSDAAVLVGMGGVDGQECAPIAVERLLDANLWHEDGHDCPSCVQPGPRHYVVHDYLKYQPSKADVEAKAEANRKRVEAWRAKHGNAGSNGASNAVGNALRTESVQPTPNPTPTPTVLSDERTKEGGCVSGEPHQRPHCHRHPHENFKGTCNDCRLRREWDEAQEEARKADELRQRREAKARRDACTVCGGTGQVEVTDDSVRPCECREAADA